MERKRYFHLFSDVLNSVENKYINHKLKSRMGSHEVIYIHTISNGYLKHTWSIQEIEPLDMRETYNRSSFHNHSVFNKLNTLASIAICQS